MAEAIVGREAELHELESFLERATRSAAALLLQGEAGMGKTTLWRECIDRAATSGTRILSCRPAAAERQLAFAALEDLLTEVTADVLPSLPPPQRRALEVALLLEDPEDDPPEPHLTSAALLSSVRRLSADAPLLLAVDDIQWIDPPSASALHFACRRLSKEPVGVLVSQRVDGTAHVPLELDRVFADALEVVQVGSLTPGAISHLLRTRLGVDLSRPVLHRVYEASGGNPFYALELGRALSRRGAVDPREPLPVPTTLAGLVEERIAELSPAVQRVLELVAALSDATVEVVQDAWGDGEESGRAIDEAVRAGVLQASGSRLRFSHPLLASGVYTSLGPHERRTLHACLAAVVSDPEEHAHQLALATPLPDESIAGELEGAASHAEARGAPTTAAELLEQALRLTPSSERAARRRREARLSDMSVVNADFERAATLAEALVDDSTGEERADALCRLAVVRLSQGKRGDVSVLVEELLQEARTDDRARAVALILSANVDARRLGRRAILERGREALAIGERLDDADIVRDALVNVTLDAAWLGEDFAEDMERAASMGHVRGIFPVGYRPESLAAATRMWFADELNETRPALVARHARLLAFGSVEGQAEALVTLSELERRAGRLDQAEAYGAAGLELGEVYIRATLFFMTGFARALRGRLDEAEQLAHEGLAVVEHAPANAVILLGWLRGAIELLRQNYLDAAEHLRRLPELARPLEVENPTPLQFHPDLVEALVESGASEEAEQVVEWLERRSGTVGHPWAVAAAARCRGLLAAQAGDVARALRNLERAERISASNAEQRPLEHGRALLALGATLRRAKRRRDARDRLMSALGIFRDANALPYAQRAEQELARIGGRAPAGSELTETERRIAELVSLGKSNKEVAAALYVAVRTVEANLTRVYAKLGVHSRTELASRLSRPPER